MANRESTVIEITPEVLLKAYACGIFPMAESADDPQLYWIEPQERGVLPLDAVNVPRRLARTVRQARFDVTADTDFEGVIEGCSAPRPGRRARRSGGPPGPAARAAGCRRTWTDR